MIHPNRIIFVFSFFFFSLYTYSQIEFVVAPNTSKNTYNSNPQCFVGLNGEVYFGATDFYGWGFWKTDGSAEGTELVTRKVYPSNTYNAFGKILIIGHEPSGYPMDGFWISDGSEEGTIFITECDGVTDPQFTTVGNKVFFRLRQEEIELWVTEGTAETTHKVSGTEGILSYPNYLTAIGNNLFFSASDGVSGTEPWISDGTSEGTKRLKDINSGSSNPYGFCELNEKVYFLAKGDYHTSLYSTDGTEENTLSVATFPDTLDILDNRFESFKEIEELGDTLYFVMKNTHTFMNDIFRYVEGDSVSLCYGFNQNYDHYPTMFHKLNNVLITFIAYPSIVYPEELRLMRIDGSGAEVYDSIMSPSGNWNSYSYTYQESDSVVYFEYADRLIRTDGTSSGTYQLNDLYVWPIPYAIEVPLLVSGERIYFSPRIDTIGTEPWVQSLIGGEPILLKDINLSKGNARIKVVESNSDRIFFVANSDDYGEELWVTLTDESTSSIIKDIYPGEEGSKPRNFIWYENRLYFSAEDSARQYVGNGMNASSNVWKSDGTLDGTMKVSEFITGYNPGTSWEYSGSEMVELNGKIILGGSAPNPDEGLLDVELFDTDGTVEGTNLIRNINSMTEPFNGYSKPYALRKAENRIFFAAETEMEGRELWVTDGTEPGTYLVKDIDNSRSHSLGVYSQDHNMTPFGDRILFTAYTMENGLELWISDGSDAGTMRLTDIQELYSTKFYDVTVINNLAVFWVGDGSSQYTRDMWVTDGSVDGTRMLRSVEVLYYYLNITEYPLGVWNNELYFTGTDSSHGFELWKTDGTSEGTLLVKDINEGPSHSLPEGFVAFGDRFYFFASPGFGDTQLWSSDGTAEGTFPVEGWDGSDMKDFENTIQAGGFLYFTASDQEDGEAMYRFFLGASDIPEEKERILTIYPNPAGDFIIIDLDDPEDQIREIKVIDLSGRVIIQLNKPGNSTGNYVDVDSLESGIYLMIIQTDNNLLSGKFLKE